MLRRSAAARTACLARDPPRCRSGYHGLCADDARVPDAAELQRAPYRDLVCRLRRRRHDVHHADRQHHVAGARRHRFGIGAGVSGEPVVRHPAGISGWRCCSASSSRQRRAFWSGYFRANPILVSIAALSLLLGGAAFATGGHRIYPGGAGFEIFKGRDRRHSGRGVVLLRHRRSSGNSSCRGRGSAGSWPWSAATFAPPPRPASTTTVAITVAYVIAGACAAMSGMLLAARYGSGDMEVGAGYDYTAIAAVLVGGTGISGGSGSARADADRRHRHRRHRSRAAAARL